MAPSIRATLEEMGGRRRRHTTLGLIAALGALAEVRCIGTDPVLSVPSPDAGAAAPGQDAGPDRSTPPGALGTVEQLVSGEAFSCVRGSGIVRCWGSNSLGQLGQDNPAPFRADVSASSTIHFDTDEKVIEIAAAYETVCALFERGSVRCWGGNGSGERGSGDVASKGRAPGDMASIVPVDLGKDRVAARLFAGTRHFCVLTQNRGDVLCWGLGQDNGRFGWLGNGRPAHIGDNAGEMGDALTPVPLPEPTVELALAFASTCARGQSGAVRCFGVSRGGQLGNGTSEDPANDIDDNVATAPPALGEGAFALFGNGPAFAVKKKDGTTVTWGQNVRGRLGLGHTDNVGTPTLLPAPAEIINVSSRSAHRCVIVLGGDLYCVGDGAYGRLGYGDTAHRGDTPETSLAAMTKPVLTQVRAVAPGGDHTCALREDGGVVCWGRNNNGQLGYGDTTDRATQPADRAEVLPPIRLE